MKFMYMRQAVGLLIYVLLGYFTSAVHTDSERQGRVQQNVCNQTETELQYLRQSEGRLLSPVTLVYFSNTVCESGNNEGTCYNERECSRSYGGVRIGPCARGFGTCCFKPISCGGSSSMNNTYLHSPNWPDSYNYATTCTMKVSRPAGVCQLRMDFKTFDLAQPGTTGKCSDDQFTVSGENKFTYLCGQTPADWHFYLDVNGQDNPTEFKFTTSATSFDRKFRIKITMIPCSQEIPSGCGQYFTDDSGLIQSFNYGSYYLAGLNYGICFRKNKGKCTTTLNKQGPSYIKCPDLYRQPGGSTTTTESFCQMSGANTFPDPVVTTNNGPLILAHMTGIDATTNYNGDKTIAGFYQKFTHNDC